MRCDANNKTQMTRQYYITEVQVFDRVIDSIPFTFTQENNVNNKN